MNLQLIEIDEDGRPVESAPMSDLLESVCEATRKLYGQAGFVRPWIGYLARQNGETVGMCGFKSPPQNSRVEIAYGTIPGHEGQGIATEMARKLVQIARVADRTVSIVAQTLPSENASTSILRKLGFNRTATVQHPEDGEVWEWSMIATDERPGKLRPQ